MIASIFEPSRAFIARFEIASVDELPEKLQGLLASNTRIPMRSHVEVDGQAWQIVGFNPIRLQERQMSIPEPAAVQPRRRRSDSRGAARRQMMVGLCWCVGGIIVTAVSFLGAVNGATGGSYVVAWGAIIFGAIRFARGYAGLRGG